MRTESEKAYIQNVTKYISKRWENNSKLMQKSSYVELKG